VDEHALAAEGKAGVRAPAARAPAAPSRGPLLCDANQNDAEAAVALSRLEVGAGDFLLRLPLAETDNGDALLGGVPLDRLGVRAADLAEQRRGGDPVAAVEQETHDQP